jgi:hypothetical protein
MMPLKTTTALEGKTFSGQMGKKGSTQGDADDFIFKNGMFRSTHCDQYGYKDSKYSAEQKGEEINFSSLTANSKGEKIAWNGTQKGNMIEGTAVNSSADGKVLNNYWFKGTLKN